MNQHQTKAISFINKTLYQPLNHLDHVPEILNESHVSLLMEKFNRGDLKQKWVILQIFEKMGYKAKAVIPTLREIVINTSKNFNRLDFGTTISDLESLDYCEEIIELIKKLKEAPEGSAKLIF